MSARNSTEGNREFDPSFVTNCETKVACVTESGKVSILDCINSIKETSKDFGASTHIEDGHEEPFICDLDTSTDEISEPQYDFLNNYYLLSFSGKKFTGKTESLKLLQERLFNKETNKIVKECAFAYPLKRKAAKIIYNQGSYPGETVETIFEKLLQDQLFKDTHRQLLIDIGMRKREKSIDYWVRPVMNEIDKLIKGPDNVCPPGSLFCITDQRFPNEVTLQGEEYLNRKDVITHFIRLESSDEVRKSRGWVPSEKDKDYSECALDNYHFEHVIRNNGTLDELFGNLMKVINIPESDKKAPFPVD